MRYTLLADELSAMDLAVAALHDQAAGGHTPLSAALLRSTHLRDWPQWLLLCHRMLVGRSFQAEGTRAALSRVLCLQRLAFDSGTHSDTAPGSPALPALSPARAAALAAGCAADELPGAAQPATLDEALLQDLYTGHWPPPRADTLDLVQLLVSAWTGALHSGRLARLQLWALPLRADSLQPAQPSLVRAPGALLLPVDDNFAEGVHRVQRLLRRVLQPGAPSVAWNLRPLPSGDLPHPPALEHLSGPSATATLAYGALYLLRDHLRPEFAELADQLYDSEPAELTITAGLDGPLEDMAPDAPVQWPCLHRVGGVDDKLAALDQLPTGRHISHRYVAHDQHSNAAELPATKPVDLAALVVRIADECNGGLDADARTLHRHLSTRSEPFTDMDLLERVARCRDKPTSIKAFLVWRHAKRASGSHSAFGDPVRLDQHYQRLQLKAPDTYRDQADDAARRALADQPLELRHLLHDDPYQREPAWCIESPPFCGKTTLLAARECDTARQALQRRRRGEPWGEVSVFLPMRAFQPPALPHQPDAAARQAVIDAFIAFIHSHSPGLPPLGEALQQPAAECPLRWRLLIDALNELPTAGMDQRRAVMALICTWLQQHQGLLLPPVFTVRELENGLDLVSQADPQWRAQRAVLQPWRRSDWHEYIQRRDLDATAAQRLHDSLRLDLDDAHGHADDTPFERFCRSPGIMAAQCTLLRRWPDLLPPRQRGTLFLALLWHCLDERGGQLPEWLLPSRLRGTRALEEARKRNWRLPAQPGTLIDQLRRQADAMQDAKSQPLVEAPADTAPPGLQGEQAEAWRQAVTTLGLAAETFDGHFAFVHQQWLEFFAALGCGLERPDLPDLTPPALDPPDEAGLVRHLETVERARIQMPAVTPQQERMRFVVEMASDRAAWLRRLLREDNLALAARVAVDVRNDLEPQGAFIGKSGQPPNCELQHLRRVLLLRSMDAGERVHQRLRAGCVVGEDDTQAALAKHMAGFGEELDAHRAQEWQYFLGGKGRDIRHRIEAGLLLGELADNLRYEYVSGEVDGWPIAGLRLKQPHWLCCGQPGSKELTAYRIGSDSGGQEWERPTWTVDLKPFQTARYAVTVQEWQQFLAGGGYEMEAPWWVKAGQAAQGWLRDNGGLQKEPWLWDNPRFTNPLQPMVGITAHEALAYAAWADALDAVAWQQQGRKVAERPPLAVPTEVLWEAAVQGPDLQGAPRAAGWAHGSGTRSPGPLDFNHDMHLGTTAPVGSHSLGATPTGLFDAQGNTWEWCSNVLSDEQRKGGWREERWQRAAQVPAKVDDQRSWRALRGGAFGSTAAQCRASFRDHDHPNSLSSFFGVRVVRVWPPHSEH
ncbi:SUMF1/EgtB/PvdO family nonheme iron enzyme [Ideonella sp. 4Y16]|uniref:SUMF1/EgtB/PvdO family nonheme iron enzyme n=1 Tax=Ideonella alba TaxID=2824118 RepID=UPI001B399F50|nr:SUMF1/EgtB/PvdO family nonheme iron enzyme [Ideonella alba]MBQ0942235.1 SUMF1/EgtB/PvdO family nonheme iron enzyme [Ideonella alba]